MLSISPNSRGFTVKKWAAILALAAVGTACTSTDPSPQQLTSEGAVQAFVAPADVERRLEGGTLFRAFFVQEDADDDALFEAAKGCVEHYSTEAAGVTCYGYRSGQDLQADAIC